MRSQGENLSVTQGVPMVSGTDLGRGQMTKREERPAWLCAPTSSCAGEDPGPWD